MHRETIKYLLPFISGYFFFALFTPKSEDCNTQIEQCQVFTPKKLEINVSL